MPQDPTLHWFFTTREILVYYGRIFRIDDLEERVTKTLKLLDLADPKVMKRQVAKLSGGQRRRVSLACAMIHEPPLLVL